MLEFTEFVGLKEVILQVLKDDQFTWITFKRIVKTLRNAHPPGPFVSERTLRAVLKLLIENEKVVYKEESGLSGMYAAKTRLSEKYISRHDANLAAKEIEELKKQHAKEMAEMKRLWDVDSGGLCGQIAKLQAENRCLKYRKSTWDSTWDFITGIFTG